MGAKASGALRDQVGGFRRAVHGEVQWLKISLAPEPGQLSFGITPGCLLDSRDALRLRNLAGEQDADFAQPKRVFRGRAQSAERSDFFHDAGVEHLFDAAIDSRIKIGAITVNEHARCSCRRHRRQKIWLRNILDSAASDGGSYNVWPWFVPFRSLRRKRFAGEQTDFDRADKPPSILAIDLFSARGIKRSQAPEQFFARRSLEPFAELWIRARQFREAMRKGFDIKARSTSDDDRAGAGNYFLRCLSIFLDVHLFTEWRDADQMMGRFRESS